MLLMVEKGITGRIWHTTYRYVKSNNKYAKNYDKKKELSYLKYYPASKYWFPGRLEDIPHQCPQDAP